MLDPTTIHAIFYILLPLFGIAAALWVTGWAVLLVYEGWKH